MKVPEKIQAVAEAIFFSFPLQLLWMNVKKNQVLLIFWLVFIAIISGNFGSVLGVPYLFLDPEYLNEVNFQSFFIIGVALGGFTMAFHITCYILDGHRFPFLGTIPKPFAHFALNNSIIPLIVLLYYFYCIVHFQLQNEYNTLWDVSKKIAGIGSGYFLMLIFLFGYFFLTNKDIIKFISTKVDKKLKKARISRVNVMSKLDTAKKRKFVVSSYLGLSFRLHSTENLHGFYDKDIVTKVFDQNHLNSIIIELFIFLVILILGIFRDNPVFQIPAAASTLLLGTIFIMFTGAISYWLRGWAITVVILFFFLLNFGFKQGLFSWTYAAFGLNYDVAPSVYDLDHLRELHSDSILQHDRNNLYSILGNWKNKQKEDKPPLLLIGVSGGGQRASLWTYLALSHLEEQVPEDLMDRVFMLSGASGGAIGAAYYRELFKRKVAGDTSIHPRDSIHLANLGKDKLNPVIFSLLVNDVFIKFQTHEYAGIKYVKERGYSFELQLNKNTGYILDKPIMAYKEPEQKADIPMLLLSPTIVNDGRKLYISPHHLSFMGVSEFNDQHYDNGKISGIDFRRLFQDQAADSLRFLSALRMNATFPYVTPTVSLPSDPPIEVMDAGVADNFGVSDLMKFSYVFREWIAENTSKVIIISIRDSQKNSEVEKNLEPSILQKFFTPINSIYNNWANIQDSNNDNLLGYSSSWLGVPLYMIDIQYNTDSLFEEDELDGAAEVNAEIRSIERASLSWRLTSREKKNIMENIQSQENQRSLKQFRDLMMPESDED